MKLENLIRNAPEVRPAGQEARTKCRGLEHALFLERELAYLRAGVFGRWAWEAAAVEK